MANYVANPVSERLRAQSGKVLNSTNALETYAVVDLDAASFTEGEVLTIPSIDELLDKELMYEVPVSKNSENKTIVLAVQNSNGVWKQLYLSSFKKTISEYEMHDGVAERTESTISPSESINTQARAQGNFNGILNLVAGHKVKIAKKYMTSKAPRIQNSVVVGVRKGTCYGFEFAD